MKYLKYLPWLVLVFAIGAVAFYQWRSVQSTKELLKLKNEQLQQANLELGRAKTTIVEQKDLHRSIVSGLEEEIKKEIKERNALITQYSELEGLYQAEQKKRRIITRILTNERNTNRIVDLPKGKIFLREEDGTYTQVESMAWSYKDFRITITGDAVKQTLSYKLHQKFKGKFVETKLPTGGSNHYAKFYELDDKDKVVGELKLSRFDVFKVNTLQPKMFRWNPKLDLAVGGSLDTSLKGGVVADVGVSFMSYGITNNDIKWRFLRFGIGLRNKNLSLSFSPFQYNIAQHLPLVSNIYLSPILGYDFGNLIPHFGGQLSVVF
jgi:hypothetical protein